MPGRSRRGGTRATPPGEASIAVPLRLVGAEGALSFLSTTTVFGTAVDVTLAEVRIETFFPADDANALAMTKMGRRIEKNSFR
jgi:hypothetical protein